jgi:hypothetical protein
MKNEGGLQSDEAMASAVLGGAFLHNMPAPNTQGMSQHPDAKNDAPLARVRELLNEVPSELRQAANEPFSARALICAWVLDAHEDKHSAQLALLGSDAPLADETLRLHRLILRLDPLAHLPLFDIAVGTMAQLSEPQKATFAQLLESLRAQLSERSYRSYCLSTLALRHLRPPMEPRSQKKTLIKEAIETVLGVLAVEGVNVPDASVAVILSGSGSTREHVQRLGRILRKREGKQAVRDEVITAGTVEEGISRRRRQHDAYQD